MRNVVLIFDMVPEELHVYFLQVNEVEFTMLKQCHGVFGNTVGVTEDHPINSLNVWLESKKDCIVYDEDLDETYPREVPPGSTLIVCGFIC